MREKWTKPERESKYGADGLLQIAPKHHAKGSLSPFTALKPPRPAKPSKTPQSDDKWLIQAKQSAPLAGSPGEAYLRGRGIDPELAAKAGCRYAAAWWGMPAVLFPIRGTGGELVAAQGRYLNPKIIPKALSGGPVGSGAFATAGAWESHALIVTEAPIDALSLASVGLPAIALCGSGVRDWIIKKSGLGTIHLALDADPAGDESSVRAASDLLKYGATVYRLRPSRGCKDWNEMLTTLGSDAFRESLPPCLAALDEPPSANPPQSLTVADCLQAVYAAEDAGVSQSILALLVERFVIAHLACAPPSAREGEDEDPFADDIMAILRADLSRKNRLVGSIERALREGG